MGIGKRILGLARANLNALMDRAAREQLDAVSEEELQAELRRRQAERAAQEEERKQSAAAEEAAKRRASTRAPDPRARGTARRATEHEQRSARRQALCRELGVHADAPLVEVKKAYRALMREHHPDRHAGDAKKQKAASDRAATITTAYAELEILITKTRG